MTSETLLSFQQITSYDVRKLLADISSFTAGSREQISAYYGGTRSETPTAALAELARLRAELGRVQELTQAHRKQLDRFDQWELLGLLDDLSTKLATVHNSSKFQRSSRVRDSFTRGIVADFTLGRNQTLEQVVERNNLLEADWTELALRNDLKEEDYTPAGGRMLRATFPLPNGLFLRSVVDSLDSGEKTKGLDLPVKTEFIDNDLAVLSYQGTFEQSVLILGQLRQGDNPDFPQDGLQSSLIVGNTLGAISYPALFRQLYATFAKDDTIASLEVAEVGHEGDGFYITVKVTDRVGEIKQQTIGF